PRTDCAPCHRLSPPPAGTARLGNPGDGKARRNAVAACPAHGRSSHRLRTMGGTGKPLLRSALSAVLIATTTFACSASTGASGPATPAAGNAATGGARQAAVAGAAGIGDPDFPTDGNGGYDVAHYDLRLTYRPQTKRLDGTARIRATAVQRLARFNLDLHGLTVHGARVKIGRASCRGRVERRAGGGELRG